MIIIPQSFLLSAPEPLTHARVGHQTYTRDALPSQVTASSDEDDTPADAPLRPDTFEFWQATSMPATWQIDLGEAKEVDYVGIAGHTIGTEAATAKVERSTDAAMWTLFSSEVMPSDDSPLMFLDSAVFDRHWRITLTGTNPPQVGVIYIGKALAMERRIYGGHAPIPLSRDTTLKRALSRGGRFLGQAFRRNGVTGAASFQNLTPAWVRSDLNPFILSARRFPFFFAWRPQTFPLEVIYAWATGDIAPSNIGTGRGLMEVSWNMRGIGHGD